MKCICVTKADVGYNRFNTDWIVIREDDPRFLDLSICYPGQVRECEDRDIVNFGTSTAYDFDGPENG